MAAVRFAGKWSGSSRTLKIGVLGGSFSPVHLGHLAIGALVKDYAHLDQVLFMPAGQHPEKDDLLLREHRVEMLNLALAGNPAFKLCLDEVERDRPSYTYSSLCDLQAKHPDWEINFILGSEILSQVPRSWNQGKELLKRFKMLVVTRSFHRVEAMIASDSLLVPYRTNLTVVPQEFVISISSTLIRQMVRSGYSVRYLVTPAVETYIYQHRLFM